MDDVNEMQARDDAVSVGSEIEALIFRVQQLYHLTRADAEKQVMDFLKMCKG